MKYMRLNHQQQRDFLAELESMVDFLETAFSGMTAAQRACNGPDGSFSPIEQVWHLADLEREGFARRIERLLQEAHPQLADFDGAGIARAGNYKQRDWQQGLDEFRRSRGDNVSILRGLNPEQWLRRGIQQGVGAVSLCDMPELMAQHDDSHRAEVEQWLEWQRNETT